MIRCENISILRDGKSNKTKIEMTIFIILLFVIAVILISGFFLIPQSNKVDFSLKLALPTFDHIFGCDYLGRDIGVRTLSGISISFTFAIACSTLSTLLSISFAFLYSTKNPYIIKIMQTIADLILSIPHIILLILITICLGKGEFGLFFAISLTHWPTLFRILCAEIDEIKTSEYIQFAKKQEKSKFYIFKKHYFRHLFPQILVNFCLSIPHVILHESSLTFLSLGFKDITPAIGVTLSESVVYLSGGYWWTFLFPGLALTIFIIVMQHVAGQISQIITQSSKKSSQIIISNINLSFDAGKMYCIIGENGAGKSTLIDALTMSPPANFKITGSLYYKESKITNSNKYDYLKTVSYIPQSLASLDPSKKYKIGDKKLYPDEMSGGMIKNKLFDLAKQKKGDFVIADEPDMSLSPDKSEETFKQLKKLSSQNKVIVVVTHNINLALKFADEIAILKDGKVIDQVSINKTNVDQHSTSSSLKQLSSIKNATPFIHKDNHNIASKIEGISISKSYKKKQVIKPISFSFTNNETIHIDGKNGAGKTTLCKIICGYINNFQGDLKVENANVQYISQNPFSAIDPKLKIKETFIECGHINTEILSNLDIEQGLLNRYPFELSGGQLQKIAIARALLSNPNFLICDEITSMLDPLSTNEILTYICQFCENLKCGIIFTSHEDYAVQIFNPNKTIYL